MPKTKKTVPIYEYKEKVNGQTRYYIRPYISGKQITKRLDNSGNMWLGKDGYTQALEEINTLEKRLDNCDTDLTYGEIRQIYLDKVEKEAKKATYFSYLNLIENHIDTFFPSSKKIAKIRQNDIELWKRKLEKDNYSIAYSQKCYRVLKSIFATAKYKGFKYNIVEMVDNFKNNNSSVKPDEEKLKYITYEQFQQFLSVIDDEMWKTFFIFLYYTGCRKGEVLALTWNDIDFISNTIAINKTLNAKIKGSYEITNTKTSQNRRIQMSKVLIEQLQQYKQELVKTDNYCEDNFIFGNKRFLPLTTIENHKKKYFKDSNLEDFEITIHEFRHSHVSLLINEYIKSGQTDTTKFFLMMSNRMGHTIPVMQETYMHLFPTVQNDIVNLLDNL